MIGTQWEEYREDISWAGGTVRMVGVCMVGQLPPVTALIPAAEIAAMHRIVGCVGATPVLTKSDMAALVLVAPFRQRGSAVMPQLG